MVADTLEEAVDLSEEIDAVCKPGKELFERSPSLARKMALTATLLKSQAEAARRVLQEAVPQHRKLGRILARWVNVHTSQRIVLTLDLQMLIAAGPAEDYGHFKWVANIEQAEVLVRGLFPGFQRSHCL